MFLRFLGGSNLPWRLSKSFDVLWNASQDKNRYVRWKSVWAISLLKGDLENIIRKRILNSETGEYMLWRCLWILSRIGDNNTNEWLDNMLIREHESKYIRYQLKLTQLAIRNTLN